MVDDIVRRNQTDEAMRDANQLNIEIVSQAGEGIIVYDRDLRYVAWNRFMERMTGALAEDVIGRNAMDLFPHLHERGVDKLLERALNGETVTSPDIQFYSTFTNQQGWVVGTYAPHKNARGEIVGVIATLQDITERKRAEESLKISESKYPLLHDTIMDAFASVDMDGRITEFNESYRRMLGYEPDELYALTYKDLTPMKWHTFEDKIVNEDVLTRGYSDIYEKEYRKKDGTVFPVELRTFLLRDEAGDPTGMWAIVRDITARKRAEEALRESKDYLDKIINSIGDPIFVKDRQNRFILANDALCALMGDTREEIIGKMDYDFFPKEQVDVFLKRDELVFETGKEDVNEETITDSKGVIRTIVTKKTLFTDASGNKSIVGIIRDITDRKHAEDALRDSENKLAAIIEFLPDATFVIDQDGKVVAWNKAMEEMTGVSKDDMIGQGDHAYTVPFYGERRKQLLDLLDMDDEEIASKYYYVKRKGDTLCAETFAPALHGDKGVYVWATAGPIFDVHGNRAGSIESIRDITERMQAEEELKKVQSSLRVAMDLVKLVQWEYDVETDMFSFDDQFYSLYGTTAEREGGLIMSSQEYARRFIPPEEASIVAEETSKALATTDPNFTSQVEHRIIRADGTEGVIAVRFGIIKDSKGRTIKTYGANQDITERKKVEEELRQNRDRLEERVRERTSEMERFIYTVSHDLRSPLVTVSGFLGQLKEDLEEGDSQRAVTDLITISEAITKMDCLLLDTLELSRIGRVANPPEEASFGQIVQEALRQTEERIKSLDVAIYVAGDMPKVRVDVPRIEEVLVNLLENSVKYMGDQASPEIDIGSRKDGGETVFFVKDNGIGIDPGEHEKVFGLFYKVNKKSEGTGVGLAIVKRIIEVLGGRIWIESELEKGCTVCFTLPLANV